VVKQTQSHEVVMGGLTLLFFVNNRLVFIRKRQSQWWFRHIQRMTSLSAWVVGRPLSTTLLRLANLYFQRLLHPTGIYLVEM